MIASLVFYAYGEPVYVLLMIGSALMNYVFALLIDKASGKARKTLLAVDVIINIGVLCFFKYTGFLVETFRNLTGMDVEIPQIILPIGISFFTFQALSYVIDVYRKNVKAQKNFIYVQLYIAFFPQLIAGPIVRYIDVEEAIVSRTRDLELIARGFRRFICGLAKKVIIANTLGQAADAIFSANGSDINILGAWIGAIAYLFQIYYDFSGYSDMAIGLGWMFGFHFRENFNYPYGSASIKEFWRRWHISLSTWFKEYLYIPLGGNRKGRGRAVLNRLIVFVCTGFWHGANWTFVLWGLFHGFFLLLEEYVPFTKKIPKWLGVIYTLLVVCCGFVIFRADTIEQGFWMIGKMFSGFSLTASSMSIVEEQLTPWFLFALVIAIIGCAPVQPLANKIRQAASGGIASMQGKWKAVEIGLYCAVLVLFAWCILRLSGNGYNPFIYFKF